MDEVYAVQCSCNYIIKNISPFLLFCIVCLILQSVENSESLPQTVMEGHLQLYMLVCFKSYSSVCIYISTEKVVHKQELLNSVVAPYIFFQTNGLTFKSQRFSLAGQRGSSGGRGLAPHPTPSSLLAFELVTAFFVFRGLIFKTCTCCY